MKFELFLLIITGFIVMNIHHDGKYLKLLVFPLLKLKFSSAILNSVVTYCNAERDPDECVTINGPFGSFYLRDKDTPIICMQPYPMISFFSLLIFANPCLPSPVSPRR